ncbi:MAG: IS5 family transposase, partial [Acutalibacteraceae bacterium]
GLGNPVKFILTGGEEHDSKQAIPLLSHLKIANSNILADKAYGTTDIRNYISNQEANYVIPPKANAKEPWDYDIWLYKERHLIECFFNKIKAFRRVATRYDKLASSFLAFVYIASIWLLSK